MILRRLGNKKKLAPIINQYFPPHNIYVEPFFGAGGMYFNKPLSDHNFLNDIDNNVYNLWNCYFYKKEEFLEAVKITPFCMGIFKHFKLYEPKDEIEKALRFLYLSNFSLYGMMSTIKINNTFDKQILINNFHSLHTSENVKFSNLDFRKFFKSIAYEANNRHNKIMVYSDPPYINTGNNYSNTFKEQDLIDLLNILYEEQNKHKYFYYMVSSFQSPFIMSLAKERNLYVTEILERRNLIKDRQTEIIMTNYPIEKDTWF